MIICQITTVHNSLDNRIFFKECISLSRAGHKVILICPHDKHEIIENVELIPNKKLQNRFLRMVFSSFIFVLIKTLKIKADVYHFHDPELMPLGLVLALMGKKVIYDIHENTKGSIETKKYLPIIIRKKLAQFIHYIEQTIAGFYSGLITARPDIADQFHHKNILVVRNLPIIGDLNKFKNHNFENKKFRVIYVGLMTELRGLKVLVDAFENLNLCQLVLLGHFSEIETLKECQKSNGWKNVHFIGKVNPDEVYSYIQSCDAGIITFLPAPNHMTTIATKPFEYMACGLPTIMSNFPYWQEIFKDHAIYVNPSSASDIAEKIRKLYEDEKFRVQLGKKSQKWVLDEMSWESESLKLLEFYMKVETNEK